MSVSTLINFLCDVRSGKLKSGLENALDRHLKQLPHLRDSILNDAMTRAIVSGNLPFAKHCLRLGADLFLQGKRFNPYSNAYELFLKTPANEKTLAWLNTELAEKDTFADRRFGWSVQQFYKKIAGCPCDACTNPDAIDPCPVNLHDGIYGCDQIQTLKTWLTTQQQQGAFHRNHKSQYAEFLAATSEYLKYLNRRHR
jgi:hypothetical protein